MNNDNVIKIVESDNTLINDLGILLLDEAGFDMSIIGVKGKRLMVNISGEIYGYIPKDTDVFELERKVKKMMGFSKGKSLVWLKKVANHVCGGVKLQSC